MKREQTPILPEKRGVRNLLISAGGLSALLGLTVLVGWYTNHLLLLQLTSTSASMASNIALIFLLCGGGGLLAIAISLAQKERHKTKLLNEINQVLTSEIAQHRQTAEALQKQTDIQHAIFSCMSEDVIVANAQGKILMMNRAAQQTIGVNLADAPADAPVNDWSRLAHIYLPDQHTPFPAEHLPLIRAFRGEMVDECEQFILQPGASKGVWRSINGRPLRDAEGKICGAITVGRNITERKRIEEALQKQTEILNSILNNMADGVVLADEEKPLLFNPAAERIFGQGVTDTKSDVWSQQYNLYLPDMKTPFPTEALPLTQAIRGTAVDKVEMFVRHADTSKSIWTEVSGRPLKDQNGVVKGGVVVCRDITDRKQAEVALQESEERWQLALRGTNDGLWDWNVKTNEVFFSQQWKAMLGFEEHEIANHVDEWARRVHPDDMGWVTQTLQDHFAQKTPFYLAEHRLLCKDGSYKWILARGQALWDAAGNAVRIVGSHTDTTERKQAEATLQESEERFRGAFDHATTGMALVAPDGRWLKVNQSLCAIVGYTEQELLALDFQSITHPDDLEADLVQVRRMLAGELQTYQMGKRYLHKRGHVVWVLLGVSLVRDAQDAPLYFVSQVQDISARKQAEAALQESEERFRGAFDHAATGMALVAPDGRWLKVNQSLCAIVGYTEQELLALDFQSITHPDDLAADRVRVHRTLENKLQTYQLEKRYLHKRGHAVWVLLGVSLIRDTQGVPLHFMVQIQDISARKQAEAALQESEGRFRSLCTASPVGIFQNDLTGACVYTNSRWQEITGLTLEESLGQGWANAIHSEDRESVFTEWQASVAMGREFAKEFRFVRPTGQVCWVHAQASPLRSDDGTVIGYVGVTMNITERKEVDRLKDEFVSVVSHELRTPLTSIRGSLGLLASGRLGTLQEKGQRMLDIAVTNTDRLVRLINDILDIERIQSGKIAMQKQECNAGDLMTQAAEVMRAMAEKAEVTLSVAPHSTRLWADPDRILQTLTNLLSNAIKFSPQGTTVWLTVEPQDGYLRFTVKDQGRGIPSDKLDCIFERFQQVNASDSRDRGGTGLGLAICRSIVQQHGGQIGVESTLGVGSVFYFILPALSHEESAATVTPVPTPQTVLVCDDNRMIGEVVTAMLEHLGYQTVTTTSGQETLQQAALLQPAAILLDLLMPEMDGWETAAALKERPDTRDIPIIILSGLSPQEEGAFPAGVTDWLCKPVEEATLSHALKRALNGQASTACVLVADDDSDFAKVLILTLQRHGIESFYARTGQEAIQLSRRLSPDLLILDLFMPDGDGFTVVNWLRQQNSLHHVPLIVYSAKDLDADERERLKLGPTLFFTKGRVKPEEFEQRVIEFLNHIFAQRGEGQNNGNQADFGH